jgi:hypothetical protein
VAYGSVPIPILGSDIKAIPQEFRRFKSTEMEIYAIFRLENI